MDTRYAQALRNATNAWANNRTTDALTMQELRRRQQQQAELSETQTVTAPTAAQMGVLQPELARYGNLGTKLNLFA